MPRAVYLTGFEHGATDALATTNPFFTALTGNVTIQSTTARNGGKALKVNAAGAVATATSTWNGSPYDLLARYYVLVESATGTVNLVTLRAVSGTTYQTQLRYDATAGALVMALTVAGTTVTATCPGITTGQWHRIDVHIDATTTIHSLDWSVNGTAQSGLSQGGASGTNQYSLTIYGDPTSAQTCVFYVDDLIVANDDLAGSVPAYPIGAGRVIQLNPGGIGTHNLGAGNFLDNGTAFSTSTNPSATLDDWPPTASPADYVTQTTNDGSAYIELAFTALDAAYTTAQGVRLVWARSSPATGTQGSQVRVRTSNAGTPIEVSSGTLANVSVANATDYRFLQPTEPTLGWSRDELNAVRARFGYATDATPDPYLLAIALEVAVAESAGEVTGAGASAALVGVSAGSAGVLVAGAGASTGLLGVSSGSGAVADAAGVTGEGASLGFAGASTGAGTVLVGGTGTSLAPTGASSGAGAAPVSGAGASLFPLAASSGSGAVAITAAGASLGRSATSGGAAAVAVVGSGASVGSTAASGGAGEVGGVTVTGEGATVGLPGSSAGSGSALITGNGATSGALAESAGTALAAITGAGESTGPAPASLGLAVVLIAGGGASVAPFAFSAGHGRVLGGQPTPIERTHTVLVEGRTYLITIESRTLTVPLEDRTHQVLVPGRSASA
jgi:hypothetical protein